MSQSPIGELSSTNQHRSASSDEEYEVISDEDCKSEDVHDEIAANTQTPMQQTMGEVERRWSENKTDITQQPLTHSLTGVSAGTNGPIVGSGIDATQMNENSSRAGFANAINMQSTIRPVDRAEDSVNGVPNSRAHSS